MDGFDSDSRVIVLAATNRPDVLDAALLRPGRFDRRVAVSTSRSAGREAILRVHARHLTLAPDVDLGRIAATAVGMVGADLANLVNESALLAAHRNRDQVGMAEFMDAMERIILGSERRIIMSPEERRRTAYHEAGHAMVGMLTPGADPVRKISIIPRGLSLGATLSAPDADRLNHGEQSLLAKIRVALGGRVAEEIVFGEPSSGAEADITQLTAIAVQMVTRWGMRPSGSDQLAVGSPDPFAPWSPLGSSAAAQSSSTPRSGGSSRRRTPRRPRCCRRTGHSSMHSQRRCSSRRHSISRQPTQPRGSLSRDPSTRCSWKPPDRAPICVRAALVGRAGAVDHLARAVRAAVAAGELLELDPLGLDAGLLEQPLVPVAGLAIADVLPLGGQQAVGGEPILLAPSRR